MWSSGGSKWTTTSTASMSRPRAATSVATSTCSRPRRSPSSAFSRLAWRRSPWMARGLHALLAQLLDQAVGAVLGADEDEDLLRIAADRRGHLDPVHLVHLEEPVLHGVDRVVGPRPPRGGPGRAGTGLTRRSTAPSSVAENSSVWCGRSRRRSTQSTCGHESHVGHAVRLVETPRLDVGHRHLAPVAEVDQPPRRGDHHVDALAQLLDLALDVRPAVDDGDPPCPRPRPSGSRTSLTCTASSRVGTSTRARGRRGAPGPWSA